jgi:thymidylate synthase
MSLDEKYLALGEDILSNGVKQDNRTGIPAYVVSGRMIKHDMSEGFPLLTTKKVAHENVFSEMEFFIRGITDKKWLQDRGNPIWNHWAWQKKVPYGNDEETKKKMFEERDLGPVYGYQWRHFGAEYQGYEANYDGQGIDQLVKAIDKVKKSPGDRRILVTAWNPSQVDEMGLAPCHYTFQFIPIGKRLDMVVHMRSIDYPLGLPFNIAEYAYFLAMASKECGYQAGELTITLGNLHIYENQIEPFKKQLSRKGKEYPLPSLELSDFVSLFDYDSRKAKIIDYKHHPFVRFPIAV